MIRHCPHCNRMVVLRAEAGAPDLCPHCGQSMRDVAATSAPPAPLLRPQAAPTPLQSGQPRQQVTDTPAQQQDDAIAPTDARLNPALDAAPVAPPAPAPTEQAETRPASNPSTGTHASTASAPTQPAFSSAHRQAPAPPRWHWALITSLTVLLALQWLLAERQALSNHPTWRPMLSSLCGVLRCQLPAWHEPDALRMLERDVRAVPASPGLLRVQARFRNEARWPQNWPQLHVTLSDASGRRLATRVFTPDEYQDAKDGSPVIGAGQEAAIAFDVREPVGEVVSFTITLE